MVNAPRYLDPIQAQHFGIQADINGWFRIEAQVGDRLVVSDMWHNIFNNREPSYRELCLEFYSTFKVKKELNKIKDIFEERCVHFRCGGVLRKISVAQFGYYTGMYSADQLQDRDFRALLRQGLYVKQSFDGETLQQYWGRISGGESWPSGGTVSVSKIRSVKIRMLHRMIVAFLVQRSTHWDKAYLTDLWLIKLFSEGAPRKFALAPLVVLDRMWNHSDAELVFGHFITKIYRRMGVFDSDACQTDLSPPVSQESFDEAELARAKIVKKMTKTESSRLLDDTGVIPAPPPVVEEAEDVEMRDAPREQPRRRVPAGIDLTPLSTEIQRILDNQQSSGRTFEDFQRRLDQEVSWLGSQQARLSYTHDYYQPMWHSQFMGEPWVPPDPIPEYNPPPVYIPPHRRDGGSYFFSADELVTRPHDLGGSPRGPVQFGRYTGGDAGTSSMPSFPAGTSAEWRPWPGPAGTSGGDAGESGSGTAPEETTDWVTKMFTTPYYLPR